MFKPARTLLPLTLLLSSTSAFAQTTPWIVSEVRGTVFVRGDAGERQIERGARVSAGQQVITAKNGNATLVRGSEFVTVRANSRITIAPEDRDRSVIQIIQDFGSALPFLVFAHCIKLSEIEALNEQGRRGHRRRAALHDAIDPVVVNPGRDPAHPADHA